MEIIDQVVNLDVVDRINAKHWAKKKILDLTYQHGLGLDYTLGGIPSSIKTRLTNINSIYGNHPFPKIIQHIGYYDYSTVSSDKGIWVVFANKQVGGGFLNTGWVQEEIIAVEFYQMSYGITQYKARQMNSNEVYIWLNLTQNSTANPNKYGGRHIRKDSNKGNFNPNNYISHSHVHSIANFVSMDAIHRKNRSSPYTLTELKHLMIKALTGFGSGVQLGLDQIHSGNWGGGAFNNQPAVILLIQGIAAWLSGVREFHFWGVKDISDHLFCEVWNVFSLVSDHSPEHVFNHIAPALGVTFSLTQILG